MNENIFDQDTLDSLHYLKYTNPLSAPILQKHQISIAIVLGTGLGPFIDALKGKVSVSYDSIPHMPKCTIQGHSGHIVIGYFDLDENSESSNDSDDENRLYCIAYAGRVHSYEGISNHEVCYQVKLSAALGCKHYILTNSTGGLLNGMYDGCLFLIKDHLRLIGRTDPLFEMRYASQWKAMRTDKYWDEDLQNIARTCANRLDIELFEGTYVYASGPNYETPLEVQTAISLGGGVVGMSTVSETIAANAYGMKVLGISMVTNLGAGISTKMLSHDEVQENAAMAIPRFILLLQEISREINRTKSTLVHSFEPKMYERFLERRHFDLANAKEHIEASRIFIEKALGLDGSHSSTMLISTDKSIPMSMTTSTSILLREIPHFPVISLSGNVGSIIYGTIGDSSTPTIVIQTSNKEGFLEEESAYIAALAYSWGITNLLHTVQGDLLNENTDPNSTVIIDDVLNFSCSTRPLALLKSIFEISICENIEKDALLVNNSDSIQNVYLSFQAPSSASYNERMMAKNFGATVIGRTNISPLYTFRYLGMKVHVIRPPFISKNVDKYLQLVNGFISDNSQLIRNRPPLPFRKTPLSISFVPVPAEINISYNGVVEAASYIATNFLNGITVKNGIIDLELNLQWPNFIVNSLPIKEIPYLSTYFKTGIFKSSDLNLLKLGSSYVLAVCGCFHSSSPFYIADASVFVRLFQELGIRGIIFTGTLQATNSNENPRHVYSIKDHINLTGENPLIGRNVPAWGPRFPDATTAYSLKFVAPEGITKIVVNCLFTSTSRLFRLEAEKKMARDLNCQVIGNLGIRELITSVHCMNNARIYAGFLGLLEEYKNVTDSNPVQDLQDIIIHYFNNQTVEN